jgi:hypothetical protein
LHCRGYFDFFLSSKLHHKHNIFLQQASPVKNKLSLVDTDKEATANRENGSTEDVEYAKLTGSDQTANLILSGYYKTGFLKNECFAPYLFYLI